MSAKPAADSAKNSMYLRYILRLGAFGSSMLFVSASVCSVIFWRYIMSIESGGLVLIIMVMGLFQNSNLWKNLSNTLQCMDVAI